MFVMPLLVSLNMIPKVALGPLIMVWFRYGIGPNIDDGVFDRFFPIVLTTARGLREVEPDLIDLVRSVIVRQLLTEGLLLAFAGAAGGLLLASWTTGALAASLASVMPLSIQFDPRPDGAIMAATTGFAVLATMVFGIGPALKMSKRRSGDGPQGADDGSSRVLGRRFSGRNILVVGQIALSLMLLTAGGLFARGALQGGVGQSWIQLRAGSCWSSTDPSLVQYDEARGRTSYRDGARADARAARRRGGGHGVLRPVWRYPRGSVGRAGGGRAADADAVEATYRIVGADYFRSLNLPMIRGREFTEVGGRLADRAARRRSSTSGSRDRLFGADDPIGQLIRYRRAARRSTKNDRAADGDRRHRRADPRRAVRSRGRARRSTSRGVATIAAGMNLHVRAARPGTEGDLLAAIRREMRALDPRLPVLQATTMQAFHDRSIAAVGRQRRRTAVPRLRRARAAARRGRALRREVVHRVAAHARDRDPHGARRASARRAGDGAEGRGGAGGGRRRDRAAAGGAARVRR